MEASDLTPEAKRKTHARPVSTKHFQPLGDVRSVEETPCGVMLGVGDERFRVDVLHDGLLRLKISQAKVFDEEPTFSVVSGDATSREYELHQTDTAVTVSTRRMKLVINRSPFSLSAYRIDGSVLFEDAHDEAGKPIGYLQLNDTFVVTRKIGPHDSIYGLGQKTGPSDRRGRNFVMWNTDILQPGVLEDNRLYETDTTQHGSSTSYDPYYSSTPFFYHCRSDGDRTRMAGFFVDNGYKARFEFEHKDFYRYQFEGGQYTEYVFSGPDMPGILADYTLLTGRIGAPPLWALGMHQCRFHDYTQKDILRVGEEYRKRKIPCDVLWLDIDYMNGYRVFTWDPKKYSDVGAMLTQLREQKFRAIAIVDPGVKLDPGYPVFEEGYARGFFCKTEGGKLYVGQVWPGRTVFPDFSREDVRAWWGDLNARHASIGLSGIWNDMNEPATGDVAPFGMRFDYDGDNHPHERFHNQYALLMAMGTYEGLKRKDPNSRPFILTRAGCAGIQRYAAQWTGDNESDWAHLALSIPMSCSMGISGQAFVGSDVPGFMGRPTAEMAVRWTQYGALTPFCRFHNAWGEPDQYPWSFGTAVESRAREAIEFRYRLLPYLYSAFIEACETGAPVQRPLVYHFQQDRQARETDDTFLLGASLLVAPVIAPGQNARNVYLPEGSWVDFHTGESFSGAQFVSAAAPLDRAPLFAKGGAVIPTLSETLQSTMEYRPEVIDLNVFAPGEDGEFVSVLREDDGLTMAREAGACLQTTFVVERKAEKIKLTAEVQGEGYPEHRRRRFRLVPKGMDVTHVRINGALREVEGGAVEFENSGEGFVAEMSIG